MKTLKESYNTASEININEFHFSIDDKFVDENGCLVTIKKIEQKSIFDKNPNMVLFYTNSAGYSVWNNVLLDEFKNEFFDTRKFKYVGKTI